MVTVVHHSNWFRKICSTCRSDPWHSQAAILNSFWSSHPVWKEKSFLHPLQHFMYCFLYYQRSLHPKKSLLAPPI